MKQRPEVIAHRGASGYAPEITLAAYRLALEMGCDGVELDVQMLRDGTLIAFHDPDVKRTTNGSGLISEYTLASIKALDAGSWFNQAHPEKAQLEFAGLQVPTLQEIFDLLKSSSLKFLIEIKNPELYPPNFEASLLDLIHENQMEGRVRFLSFSARSLQKIKALKPTMRTVLLMHQMTRDLVETVQKADADELGILHMLATPALIEAVHKANLSFSVWTVDQVADMQRLMDWGVDCITSNYPDRLLRLLGRLSRS